MESYQAQMPKKIPSDRIFEKGEGDFSRSIELTGSMKNNLGQILDEWWRVSCGEAKTLANTRELYKIEDILTKLANNVLDHGDGSGKVSVFFKNDKIICVVENSGNGFDQPVETINVSICGGYGLGEVVNFADRFLLETSGKRYEKTGEKISIAGFSDVRSGSRITCEKNILGSREN